MDVGNTENYGNVHIVQNRNFMFTLTIQNSIKIEIIICFEMLYALIYSVYSSNYLSQNDNIMYIDQTNRYMNIPSLFSSQTIFNVPFRFSTENLTAIYIYGLVNGMIIIANTHTHYMYIV